MISAHDPVQGLSQSLSPEELAAALRALLEDGSGAPATDEVAREFLRDKNPIDVAMVLGDLQDSSICRLFDLLPEQSRADLLPEAGPREQALLLMHVGERSASLISSLDPDDAADVLEAMDEEDREAILQSLDSGDAEEIRTLREYDSDSAGGLMTPLIVTVGLEARQGDVLAAVRGNPDAETINVVYVVEDQVLKGVLSIRDVLMAHPSERVTEYMTTEIQRTTPETDQEEVIRLMETYHLGALPVTDENGYLLGAVTADDALTALEEEASEDVLALAGAGSPTEFSTGVWGRVRMRVPWLMLTLVGGVCAAWVMRTIGAWMRPGETEAVSDLAKFMPLVAGLAGNVGMQSSAVMLRGFATGGLHRARVKRVIIEEIEVAALNGLLCGLVAGVMAWFVAATPTFSRSVAIGLSIAAASGLAGIAGSVIPTICDRLGIDPAISAGPFITTLNDVVAFSIYMIVSLGVFQL